MKKLIILSLALVLTLSTAVLATTNVTPIESNPDIGFIKTTGTISDIERDEKSIRVSFLETGAKEVAWILLLREDSTIVDGKSGNLVPTTDLKKDQKIELYYRKNTPVLQSYPAQFTPTVIFIPTEDGYFADVDYYDEEGTGQENRLVILPSDKTAITDMKGRKLGTDGLSGRELIVLYRASTKSLPPQTNPDRIYVLDKENVGTGFEIELSGNSVKYTLEPISQNGEKLYPVRQIFENGGAKVNWINESKTIEITRNGKTKIIETGTKTVRAEGSEIILKGLTIIDGRTYASVELFK